MKDIAVTLSPNHRNIELFTSLQCHVFLRLWVESGIHDLTADEDPHVILDLEGFDVDVWAFFLFFLDSFQELFTEELRHVIHVSATFRRRDTMIL